MGKEEFGCKFYFWACSPLDTKISAFAFAFAFAFAHEHFYLEKGGALGYHGLSLSLFSICIRRSHIDTHGIFRHRDEGRDGLVFFPSPLLSQEYLDYLF